MSCHTAKRSSLTLASHAGLPLAALLVGLIVGCAPAQPAARLANTEVRIGLIPSSGSAPILAPIEAGDFAARGLNVSVQPFTDTAQAMISVAAGQLEMGNVTMGAAALNAFNRGTDLKIVAAAAAEPTGHGSYLPVIVRTELIDSGLVKSVADLKGRKVALNGKGIIPEYALAKALATANLKPSDVDVVTMPYPQMVVALSTGAIDAGLLLQPTGAQAVAKGVGKILTDDYNQNAQNAVIVANTRFLEQHRAAVTRFLEVYVRAIRRLSDDRFKEDEQALAAVQKHTNVPLEVIRLAPDPYWPKDGRVILDSVRDEQAFFMSSKSVDYTQPMDIQKLIDYGPLEAALKNLGG